MRRAAVLLAGAVAASCVPNPRNAIPAIVDTALRDVARRSSGADLCVERTIAAWQSADEVMRHDPPAPPGFASLLAPGTFRGGGGIKGERVGGMAVRGGPGCFDLRGPLVAGDRAMIEVHVAPVADNLWLRRSEAGWRVVAMTTGTYLE